MENKPKLYKLSESPFYKLGTKSKLAEYLKTDKSIVLSAAKNQNYNSFTKEVGSKLRDIDSPRKELRRIQSRIKELLSRIETPPWLFSGKKGVSYIDNAKFHADSSYFLTCDIKSFYPSCTSEKVFQIFKYTFKTNDDVAWILSRLVTFQDKIPTGSPSSQIVAFWAYYPTFCRIYKHVSDSNAKISLYVDDITISSKKPIPPTLLNLIKKELNSVGHTVKDEKTRYYGKDEFKIVTGVAISPDGELKVPNKRRKKIMESLKEIEATENVSLGRSIKGQLNTARMIESSFMKDIEKQGK